MKNLRKRLAIRSIVVMLFCFVLCLGTGCRPKPAVQSLEVVIPDNLTIEGARWHKEEWSESVQRRVDAYFKASPFLAENPSFSGRQVCYANESGRERCYWVLAADDSSQWIMIEFDGTKGSEPIEGVGQPFLEMKKK